MPIASLPPAIRAALWMVGALLSFSAMAIAGRELSKELSIFQILVFRSIGGFVLLAAVLQRSGWEQVRTHAFGTHLLRNIAHFAGQYAWFYGIALISLTEVFAIEFTVPIWTAILAAIFLGERLSPQRMLAVALGFAGILVMLRPGTGAIGMPVLVVLGGAVCFAIAYIFMKRLTVTESAVAIPFYMTVIQFPLGLLPALPHWAWPSPWLWPAVAVVAVCAVSGHYCLARAFRLADATLVVPMDFLRLPLIAVVGYVYYGEALTVWLLVGSVIVLFATWLNLKTAQ
jgi:drug/metabolite transporter (DMT)-like permease